MFVLFATVLDETNRFQKVLSYSYPLRWYSTLHSGAITAEFETPGSLAALLPSLRLV